MHGNSNIKEHKNNLKLMFGGVYHMITAERRFWVPTQHSLRKKLSQISQFFTNVFASITYRIQVAGKRFNTVTHTILQHYAKCRTDILFRIHQHRLLVTYFETALLPSQH
jgi:hypothetical protein